MPTAKSFFAGSKHSTLDEVLKLIQNRYVDSVSSDSLSTIAINSVLEELDPHSYYIPKTDVQEANENLEGNYQGIGVEFDIFNDTINILGITPSGPAERAGLKTGDQIIAIDGKRMTGQITSNEVKKMVRGPLGTIVALELLRDGKRISQKLERGFVPLKSIDAAFMMGNGTGYIKLNMFSNSSYKEFMEAIQPLLKEGMKSLVLDLRDNGGGLLEEATDIADEFIDGDKLIVYTKGLNSPKKEYRAKRKGIFESGKLVVLMNERSASASEALAGALQDQGRAIIAGKRSFGKGLVQEQFTFSDGSAMRMTVARYFTPKGRCIQKPYGNDSEAYAMEIYHRNEKDTIGGINPDWDLTFEDLPIDTNLISVLSDNSLKKFAFFQFKQKKTELKNFKNFYDYSSKFNIKENEIAQFLESINKSGNPPRNLTPNAKAFLARQLKALVAEFVWGSNGYNYCLTTGLDKQLEVRSGINSSRSK